MTSTRNRLLNLTIAIGVASARGAILERAGYGYLTSRLSGGYFFRFVSLLSIDTLVECGANAAETSIHFIKNFNGQAIAIEANPLTFQDRTSKSSLHGVIPICVALSDSKGITTLKVPTDGNLIFDGASSLSERNDDLDYKKYEIQQSTLDIVLEENLSKNFSHMALWVDVEGRALEVLKGAQATISSGQIALIYVEVETFEFWEKQKLAPDVDDFLQKNNFTPVIRDMQSINQFNLLYVRDDLLAKCDELVIDYWRELANLKLGFWDKYRYRASAIKRKFMSNKNSMAALSIHIISALFGSKSSRTEIFNKLKRK